MTSHARSSSAGKAADRGDEAEAWPDGRDAAAESTVVMAVVATWITSQLVFNGVIAGLEIGLLAMGIVLIYRSTRVINFAVGNMGLVGASLLALLAIEYDIPFWLAAIGSLIVGTLFGTLMDENEPVRAIA